jgi:glycosyltransferase involved in cell wall biosynthesis
MNNKDNLFQKMREKLLATEPVGWKGISEVLADIMRVEKTAKPHTKEDFLQLINKGIAFVTYDYGIDGVSIEINKYAKCLEQILAGYGRCKLHFIGGDFYDKADTILEKGWGRFELDGANGWSKWDGGSWFSKLYYEDMTDGTKESEQLAAEMWEQGRDLAIKMGRYITENDISLIIPVNVCSNPGNLAFGLAIAIAAESLGLYVINSSHDYYWEGGKKTSEKQADEPAGVRDHFFRNSKNKPFFDLFEKLYPLNGQRWLQVNINRPQSRMLIEKYEFSKDVVSEITTAISDEFFKETRDEDVKSARLRMAHILSDGHAKIKSIPIDEHLEKLDEWMQNQKPIVVGSGRDCVLDPTKDGTIYLLQPTRVIGRKRIEKDVELIRALLGFKKFRKEFKQSGDGPLVLHITGPVPIEHKSDLEKILIEYKDLCAELPGEIAARLFIAFSVGNEEHDCFAAKGFKRLYIQDIYRLATAIVFPSEVEGRGLPIIESSSAGIPIICSRYSPLEVFDDVVGKGMDDKKQIRYTLFEEEGFSENFLSEVTDLLLFPKKSAKRREHNIQAVKSRYSMVALRKTFTELLNKF